MTEPSGEPAVSRIADALDLLRREMNPLKNILEAFGGIFLEKARLKAEIPPFRDFPLAPVDRLRFEQGVPLTSEEALLQIPTELWNLAAARIIPALEHGFPKLARELSIISRAFLSGHLNPERCHIILAQNLVEEAKEIAVDLGVDAPSLQFILGQIAKPLAEKKGEALGALIVGFGWHRGYCPVCGSPPELSFIQEEGGPRRLRCALCGHHWRFVRPSCPYCGNEDQEKLLFYFIAGREQERAEVCEKCKRYVLGTDWKGSHDEAVLEVAAIGMVHLDVLAQEKGFLPAAVCAWNVVRIEDISSFPVAPVADKMDS